ncbi:MAG: DUF433 domain-containing protein [Anaerolineaceae bacterium]|nr:DUF433 domain-containing protein [Anaerolineaceae bacterium]MCB9100792.1 DUF433 domain-containing protein [Anaerolineales bacterium]
MDTRNHIQIMEVVAVNPNVRKSRPFILGTSVTVADVAMAKNYHNLDADGIADWYGLTLPQVYGALAYYYEHKEDIDRTIRDQIKKAEALKDKRVGGQNSLLP